MPAFRPRLRALLVGAAAIALVTVGAGGTLAASTTPTVYACYNANGQVAMASIPQCKLTGGGQLVSINTQGLPGPTGPTGAQGPAGPAGPTGAPDAPTRVEWDFTVPECERSHPARSSSTTVFPAGTRLTPMSGEITAISGPGVPHVPVLDHQGGRAATRTTCSTSSSTPPARFPCRSTRRPPQTLAGRFSVAGVHTLCGTSSVPKPGASRAR